MSDIGSTLKNINSNKNSDLFDASSLASTSTRPRSVSLFPNWTVNYKPMPQKSESKGVWDGYQTQVEFMTIHLR